MASFSKRDRLSEEEAISLLFDRSGKVVKVYPIIFIIREYSFNTPSTLKVLFSIPRKRVKLAVDRNLIKRRMKEVHRINLSSLRSALLSNDSGIALGVLFTGKEIPSFQIIESAYSTFLEKISSNNR